MKVIPESYVFEPPFSQISKYLTSSVNVTKYNMSVGAVGGMPYKGVCWSKTVPELNRS